MAKTVSQPFRLRVSAPLVGAQSFATRRSQPGVVRWCGFDSAADLGTMNVSPINYPGPDKGSTQNANYAGISPIVDMTKSASPDGGGSLRFLVKANDGSGNNVNWWMNFGTIAAPVLFDENEQFFVQWRQWFSQDYLDIFTTGTKFNCLTAGDIDGSGAAMGKAPRENSTFCEISQIVLNNNRSADNGDKLFQVFHRCPADGGTLNFDIAGQPTPWGRQFNWQNARPNYCVRLTHPTLYPSRTNPQQANPGTCLGPVADEWMTFKWGITLGSWGLVRMVGATPQYGFQNSRVRLWMARQGQASEPIYDYMIGLGTSYVANFHRGYGKVWFTPRGGGEERFAHPAYSQWVDEVIVSRNDIADPA
jgi:hypothetical protein